MWTHLLLFKIYFGLIWLLVTTLSNGQPMVSSKVPTACYGWQNGVCNCVELKKLVNCTSRNLTQFPTGIPNDTLALNADKNSITTVPDLLYLSKLQTINLKRNMITKVPILPKTIGKINLAYNKIQHFTTEFLGMENLVELELQFNLLEYLPERGFLGCSWLTTLYLSYNHIKFLNESNLEGLDSISTFKIQKNLISKLDVEMMKIVCKYGTVLNFGKNLLTSLKSDFFNGCSIIDDLYFRDNQIPILPEYLFQSPKSTSNDYGIKLGSVHLQNMTINEINDRAFFGVRQCGILWLSMNRLQYIPKALTNLNVVNYIMLGTNKIKNIPDLAFNGSRKVRGIFLNGNLIQRIPKNAFAKLGDLKELYLYKNRISVIEPGAFKDNPLELLYLFDNKLIEISPNLFMTSSRSIFNLHIFFSPIKNIHPSAFTELAENAEIIGTCTELESIPKLQANISLQCMGEFRVPKLKFPPMMCKNLIGNGYSCRTGFRQCFCYPCSKGYYGSLNILDCIPCPPGGYYLDEIGASKGFTYYDNCKTCKNGTYISPDQAPARSPADCQVCPFGTKTNQVAGSRACRCIDNYYRRHRFGNCSMCTTKGIICPFEYQKIKPGFWWYWQSVDEYYRYSNFTWALEHENYKVPGVAEHLNFSGSLPFAQECPRPKSCPGNTINTICADGFTGWMCTECEDGFYPWFDSCNECPSVWHFLLVYGVIILALVVLTGLILWIDSKRNNVTSEVRTTADMILARAKIVIGFYQVLAGIFSTLNYIHWPQALANIGQHLQNIALNIIKIASPQCLDARFKMNAYREFIFGIACPIFVISATFLIYIIKKFVSNLRTTKCDVSTKMAETKRLCFQYTLSLLFLTYPNSCNTIFSLFPSICKHFWIDETRKFEQTRLISDYSISCKDESYKTFMFAAYVSLIYVIGFPLVLLFLLWKFRCASLNTTYLIGDKLSENSENLDTIFYQDPTNIHLGHNNVNSLDDAISHKISSPTTIVKKISNSNDPYGLRAFHESYNSRCWFWEVIELVRKLTLTSLVIFFGSTSRTQIGGAAFLAIVFLMLHVAFQPMKDNFEHWLQLLSLATIVLNLLVGVILMVPIDNKQTALDRADDVGVQIILVLVDFGIILLFTVSTLRSLYKAFRNISKDDKAKKLNIDRNLRFTQEENDDGVNIDTEPLII